MFGKTHTEKVKTKLRIYNLGKHLSKETIEKIRLTSMKPEKINLINTETNEKFTGTRYEFWKKFNTNSSSISALILKRRKKLNGWVVVVNG